jgi:hypothetical protein
MANLLKRPIENPLNPTKKFQKQESKNNIIDNLIEDFNSKLTLCQECHNNIKKRKSSTLVKDTTENNIDNDILTESYKDRIKNLEDITGNLKNDIQKLQQIISNKQSYSNDKYLNDKYSDDKYWNTVVN